MIGRSPARRVVVAFLLLGAWALAPREALAQRLLIDRGVRAGNLWCFPLVEDERTWVYLSQRARLATDDDGRPEFSLIRYVLQSGDAVAAGESIGDASGGGVLHMLVLYDTPEEEVRAAERALRRVLEDDEVSLRGPVIFEDGRYNLISSVLVGNDPQRAMLASGSAPLLEGNRLALSFDLEPEQTALLLESLSMDTSDVSLVFEMGFSGIADAYDAELLVDWSEVRESIGASAGGTIYFVSADVETTFDKMMRDGAIELRSRGSDSNMEALLDRVYARLLELMFERVPAEQIPPQERGGLTDALGSLIDNRSGGPLSSRQATGFGIYAGFRYKQMRTEGQTVLDFRHAATVQRRTLLTFNVGDLYRRLGDDPGHFRTVNLLDAAFQQRQIRVAVDGSLLPEFDRLVNSVTVTLRKRHENGEETVREVVINRESANDASALPVMTYGWNEDHDRIGWLAYEYRTQWSFEGGGTYATDWVTTSAAMIDLFAPYERRRVELIGDRAGLAEVGVRAVVVQIAYPFFDDLRRDQQTIRVGAAGEPEPFEITLPSGRLDYDYTVTWILAGGRRISDSGTDSSGVVFIDEIPDEAPLPGAGGAQPWKRDP